VVHSNDGNAGTNDLTGGKYLMETERSTKNLSMGVMKTMSATMGTMEQCDGEPTEDDVVYNLDGTIGFGDRSLGGKFLMAGKKKRGTTSENNKAIEAAAGSATREAKSTGETRDREGREEDQKLSPEEFILGEKERWEKARKEFGIDKPKTLAATLASGGQGSMGIGKLTLLQSKKETKKAIKAESLGIKKSKTKLEIIREGVITRNHQAARGIGGSIGQFFGSAVDALKSKPAAKTAAAVMRAAGAIPKTTKTAKVAIPTTHNTTMRNSTGGSVPKDEMEDDSDTIGLASLFGQDTRGGSHEGDENDSNDMEEDGTDTGIMGIETAQVKWSVMERALKQKEGYNVRYEYSEKPTDLQRSTHTELYALAEELWIADPELEMYSFNEELRPITGIDYFPSSSADYQEFFARECVLKNGKRNHVFGFYIQTQHPLSELTQFNDKALQKFLAGRKTWLRTHVFDSLLVDQVGWLACKMVGAHLERLEYRLQQQLWVTVAKLNNTAKYSGANRINATPALDITRRPVYESDGTAESNSALTISCKSSCAELLKTLLVHADLEKNKFGIFMQQSTKMTNQVLHKSMYQEHLAFTQDMTAIPVEGLHLDVLEELIRPSSLTGEVKTVQELLLDTKRDGVCPIWAIEYTTRSMEEGRFIFVTDNAGAAGTKSIIENELVRLAQKTTAFARHLTDNDNFTHGIRLATKWMTRRERHESGVMARQGAWQGDARLQARQSRNRVIVIESPWSLDDHPLLATGNGNQVSGETATYAQMAMGQFYQQSQQQPQQHHNQSLNGRTSPTNRSTTSELGFDDAATIQSLISTVAEQSERMQAQSVQIQAQSEQMQVLLEGHATFKENLEAAVELQIQDQHDRHMATIEDMEVRQKQRETEHSDKLQAQEDRLQDELREMIRQFDDRNQALHEAKVLADEQQRRRDVEISDARIEERRLYDSKVDSLTKKSDDTLSMLAAMRQMMEAAAQVAVAQQMPQQMVLPTPSRRQTMARQSLPSQVELDVDMEDASQLTNTLSGSQGQDHSQKLGADEVFSPPRITKKRQATRPASSLNTKETHASTASYGSSSRQGTNLPSFGLITQLDHDEAVKRTMGEITKQESKGTIIQSDKSGKEPLTLRTQHEREELLSRLDGEHEVKDRLLQQEKETGKTTRESMEPRSQQVHEETLELSGTAPNAEALAKFQVQHEGMDQVPNQEEEAGKTTREPIEPRIRQDHEETIALSGTAPNAEALAKFSVEHEGNDHVPQQAKEAGVPTREPMEPRIRQDHEETIALSGTVSNAEALAKFSVEYEGNDHVPQQVKEAGKATQGPMEPRNLQGHEENLEISGTAPNAEALAKFYFEQESDSQPLLQGELNICLTQSPAVTGTVTHDDALGERHFSDRIIGGRRCNRSLPEQLARRYCPYTRVYSSRH
jgi:hypothetical protein